MLQLFNPLVGWLTNEFNYLIFNNNNPPPTPYLPIIYVSAGWPMMTRRGRKVNLNTKTQISTDPKASQTSVIDA